MIKSKIKTLKKAQDYLGKLNDMRVALEILPQIFQDEQNLDEGDGLGMRNNLQMKMRDIFELEKQNSIIGFPRFWVVEFDERFWGELEDQIRQI